MIGLILKLFKYLFAGVFGAFIPIYYYFIKDLKDSNFEVWRYIGVLLFPLSIFYLLYRITKKSFIKSWFFTCAILSPLLLIFNDVRIKEKDLAIEMKLNYFAEISLIPIFICFVVLYFTFKPKKKAVKKRKKKDHKETTIIYKTSLKPIYLDNPQRGIYIQGGAGAGKSASLFLPTIKQITSQNYAGILYDFKSGELTKHLYKNIDNSVVKPYFIDFKRPNYSNRVNILNPKFLIKSAYVFEYSEVIMNNLMPETIKQRGFFDRDAQSVLTGVIWYVKKHHPKYCSLPHIVAIILSIDTEKLLNKIKEDTEVSGMVVSLLQAMNRGAEKQVAGVISTLQTAISKLNTPDLFWLLSGNDFDLDLNSIDSPKFLCIGNDSTIPTAFAPAISLIISVCTRIMNEPNKNVSALVIDEFPTLYLPNIEQVPATARSNKISTIMACQDYSQIVDKYGKEKAEVLISNLGNQFFGRSSNFKSAEMIKNLFSKEDRTFKTTTKGTGTSGKMVHLSSNNSRGSSESIQERDRVKVSDIINLEAGEFCGIIAEGNPKEFIKARFDYDSEEVKESIIDVPFNSDTQIQDNYEVIFKEVKSIF